LTKKLKKGTHFFLIKIMEYIKYQGKIFLISSDKYEKYEDTLKRSWYISQQKPKTDEEFNNFEALSYINLYENKYNCEYGQLDSE
jgi:hypothetical protein